MTTQNITREPVDEEALRQQYEPLFVPAVIAVAGASTSGNAQGNTYLRQLESAGYGGRVVVIHPSATEIDGYPAYPSFAEVPDTVDYAYVAVPSKSVPALIASGRGNVRFAQVISSGFGEGDGSGSELAEELREAARAAGTRIIGPNSLGTHSPRGGFSYVGGADPVDGTISIVSQSGGLSVDMIRKGRSLGLRYRSVVNVGNALDVNPVELLEFYLADPGTTTIGLYLEDLPMGREFVRVLRRAAMAKPIVVLKGGLTAQGSRAAASHTGAAATDERLWTGMARQFGFVLVGAFDAFLDSLQAFQALGRPLKPRRQDVVLLGNGGGVSVLAADELSRAGLEIRPMSERVVTAAQQLGMPPGASVVNPVDLPAGVFASQEGRLSAAMLGLVLEHEQPGAVIVHLNLSAMMQGPIFMAGFSGFLAEALPLLKRHVEDTAAVLVLNGDGSVAAEDLRRDITESARAAGLPVVTNFVAAAQSLTALNWHETNALELATERNL